MSLHAFSLKELLTECGIQLNRRLLLRPNMLFFAIRALIQCTYCDTYSIIGLFALFESSHYLVRCSNGIGTNIAAIVLVDTVEDEVKGSEEKGDEKTDKLF